MVCKDDLIHEMAHLKQVYATNINETELKSIDLLNKLLKLKLEKKNS